MNKKPKKLKKPNKPLNAISHRARIEMMVKECDERHGTQREKGWIMRFIEVLGANKNTIFCWTKWSIDQKPPIWQLSACEDAFRWRTATVDGWKCRECLTIEQGHPSAVAPRVCRTCGCAKFIPVAITSLEGKK